MIKKENASLQEVSWVKSNKDLLEIKGINNLYYPETKQELVDLCNQFYQSGSQFDVIGYSSNTLFLPSYHVENMICTKKLNKWEVQEETIICDSGVYVGKLAKYAVRHGWKGFEGLVDLPGTVGAALYGNAGCYGCLVTDLVMSFELLLPDGTIRVCSVEDLSLKKRSSSLKRKELKGIIVSVSLRKEIGDVVALKERANEVHVMRLATQPGAANNLGTTFLLSEPSFYGTIFNMVKKIHSVLSRNSSISASFHFALKVFRKSKYIPYTYILNRYMFIDYSSHEQFYDYCKFLSFLYDKVELEIEVYK